MSNKKDILNKIADRRIRFSRLVFRLLILFYSCIILYDSFVYSIPLHYILFVPLGRTVGNLYKYSFRVYFDPEQYSFKLRSNIFGILIYMLLLLIRLLLGPYILKSFHLVHISDAISLFFIGIYMSKWKVIMKQMEELIYRLVPGIVSGINKSDKEED